MGKQPFEHFPKGSVEDNPVLLLKMINSATSTILQNLEGNRTREIQKIVTVSILRLTCTEHID